MNKEEINFGLHLEINDKEEEKGNFFLLWDENNGNEGEIEIIEGIEKLCFIQEKTTTSP